MDSDWVQRWKKKRESSVSMKITRPNLGSSIKEVDAVRRSTDDFRKKKSEKKL